MLIGNGYLEFRARKQIHRVNPGDIFMNNGHSILFLPGQKRRMYGRNYGAQKIPKKEWELIAPFLVITAWCEAFRNGKINAGVLSIGLQYYEYV